MTFEIMMPFYGSFDQLRLAIASILAQSDPDWRLTVIDDVYPDLEPGRWVSALDDDRVTYIRNDKNLGPSGNFDKCAQICESEFVVIMGCDDLMLPGYVAHMKQLIAEYPGVDIIQPGVRVINEHGDPTRPLADVVKSWYRLGGKGSRVLRGQTLMASLLRGNWAYFPSLAWRTSRLVEFGFRHDLDVVQDLAMSTSIILDGGELLLDDTVVFAYRRHSSSYSAITGPDGSKFAQERSLFAEVAARCEQMGWTKAANAARLHLSSRLHAITELPKTFHAAGAPGRRALMTHITGR